MEEEEHDGTPAVPELELQVAATMVQREDGLQAKVFALEEVGRNPVVALAGKLSISVCINVPTWSYHAQTTSAK